MKSLTDRNFLSNFGTSSLTVQVLNVLKDTEKLLKSWATSPNFVEKVQGAFGNNFNSLKIKELAASWAKEDYSNLPPIEIRDAAEINHARGAFAAATNKIYLSQQFINENKNNVETIASVILEEYGHYIDSLVNAIDTPGDEGEIFAALALGKVLNELELAELKREDDRAIVVLDGQQISLEQNTSQFDTLDFFAKDINLGKDNVDWKDESLLTSVNPPFNLSIPSVLLPGVNLLELEGNLQSSFGLVPYGKTASAGRASFKYPVLINVSRTSQDVGNSDEFSLATTYNFSTPSLGGPGANFADAGVELQYGIGPINFNKFKIGNTPFGSLFEQDLSTKFEGFPKESTKFTVGFQQEFGKLLKFEIDTSEVKALQLQNQGNPLKTYGFGSVMEGKGKASFVKLEGDVDAALAELVPAYRALNKAFTENEKLKATPIGGELTGLGFSIKVPKQSPDGKLPRAFVDFGLDVANLTANLELGLEQTFTFKPENVSVSVSVDQGAVVGNSEGNLGTEFKFQAPTSGSGIMTVTSKYKLLGEVENKIDLISNGFLKLEVLKAELAFKFPLPFDQSSQFTSKGKFGPLFDKTIPENGLTIINKPLVGLPGSGAAIAEIPAAKLSELPGEEDATKDLEIEKKYYIPYNMPYSFTASSFSANEGDGSQTFSVQRNGDTSEEETVTIAYGFTGDSANSSDYSAGETTVTFQPGEATASFDVSIVDDTEQESSETYTVYLKDSSGNSFPDTLPNGKPTISTTGIITDNDKKPDPPNGGRATSFNDPRIVTFDNQYHEFQGAGEFTLVESASGDLKIQVRQEPIGNNPLTNVSDNTAVATLLGGKRVGIYKGQGVLIDGIPTEIPENQAFSVGNGRIFREGYIYTLVYPTGDQLVARVLPSRVNINVYLTRERQEKVAGLLGNANRNSKDDLAKRDGTVLSQPVPIAQLYGEYADSWRVTQAESLFDYKPGEDTNTFTQKNYPRQKVTLRDLNPLDIQRAEERIGDRITDPTIREVTIIDYILTGFDETVIEGAIASSLTPESILIIATPPRAFEDFSSTKINTAVTINVLSNDEGTIGVPLAIANFDSITAKGGTINLDDNGTTENKSDDRLIYTPPAEFADIDTFNYTLSDGKETSTAKVSVLVNAPLPPFATEDFSITKVNTPVTIDVLANDIATEGILTIADFNKTSTAGGTIELDNNNTPDDKTDDRLIYIPPADFADIDNFNYTISDGKQSSTAKVTVLVNAPLPPFAAEDFSSTTVNTPVTIDVLANDIAFEGILTIADFDKTSTAGGTIALNDNNTPDDKTDDRLTYTPTANFTGTDTFNYIVSDGDRTTTAKVTIETAAIELSKLDGSNGFVLNGVNEGNFAGISVSKLGDFNGDGFDDIIIGAFGADPNGNNVAGESYVFFGKKGGFPASIDLPNLDGSNGFILNGVDVDGFSGGTVSSAGDINGDGLDDLIIGAFGAPANGKNNAGKSYVIFGSKGVLPAKFNLSELNGSNGFVIQGVNEFDYLGLAASGVGDINADGIEDLLVSAPGPLNGTTSKSYIIYGRKEGFPAILNSTDINGTNGFVIDDIDGKSGTSVSAAGDVNGDRIDDIIINSDENDSNNYVVFGSANGFPANFNLSELNGSNGFVLDTSDEKSGTTVSKAGDINGDGIDDLIIALVSANSTISKSYVVFGNTQEFSPRFDLNQLNGRNGFTITNVMDGNSISAINSAGDLNGDGIDDLAIGVAQANSSAGKTYVLFGSLGGFYPTFNLSKINGNNGLVIHGINPDDLSGASVSAAGDINGDRIDDLIIGSPGNFFNNSAGKSHVVFGSTLFDGSYDSSNPMKELFNPAFYLNQNPDVREAITNGVFRNAFEHFIEFGLAERRNPSSLFASNYLINNPDVSTAVANGVIRSGFEHFMSYGLAEKRNPNSILASLVSLEKFYISQNQDIARAVDEGIFSNGLEHLLRFGIRENRPALPHFSALLETFDSDYYLAVNSDVEQAVNQGIFSTGFDHFINFGLNEGRDPSNGFNNSLYLSNNPDVAADISNGLLRSGFEHFMKFGFGEDRFVGAIAS